MNTVDKYQVKKKKIEKDQLPKSEFVIYMTIEYILYMSGHTLKFGELFHIIE